MRGPSEHVPVVLKPEPLHTGHGLSTVRPVNTLDVKFAVEEPEPVSGFAVPVIEPFTLLTTQTGTPPDESGSGAPKKNAHEPPLQSPSAVQVTEVSLAQR